MADEKFTLSLPLSMFFTDGHMIKLPPRDIQGYRQGFEPITQTPRSVHLKRFGSIFVPPVARRACLSNMLNVRRNPAIFHLKISVSKDPITVEIVGVNKHLASFRHLISIIRLEINQLNNTSKQSIPNKVGTDHGCISNSFCRAEGS